MDTEETQASLKPCPFCAGKPRIDVIGNEHTKKRAIHICCTTFGCTIEMRVAGIRMGLGRCLYMAAEKWNTRKVMNGGAESAVVQITVKGCEACPYRQEACDHGFTGQVCSHDDAPRGYGNKVSSETPEWCPLGLGEHDEKGGAE